MIAARTHAVRMPIEIKYRRVRPVCSWLRPRCAPVIVKTSSGTSLGDLNLATTVRYAPIGHPASAQG